MNTLPAVTDQSLVAKLAVHVHQARGAYAEATERRLRAGTQIFTAWCADRGHEALPAEASTLSSFIDDMAGKSVSTVRNYLWAVSRLHLAAGLDDPTKAEAVRLAVKRMTRTNGTRAKQAAPLNRPLIDSMIEAAGDDLIGLRDKALLATAYDTLCRRSEIVALDVDDLAFTDDGTGTVLIRRSKTDQAGEGQVRFLAHDTTEHLKAWIEAAKIEDGALFRAVHKGGAVNGRLHANDVSRIFKRRAKAAGVDPAEISGHSSRVGAAQDLVAADLGVAEVMQAGGWKTPTMVARYTEHLQARRGAMSKLAAKQGRL